jgi:hypothetical protein
MTALRVGVDIDDVLYPWYDRAHAACVAAGITNNVTPSSWSPYTDYGCTDQEWFDVLGAGAIDGTLYNADPIPGALHALDRLRDAGHTIHLVTARGALVRGRLIRAATIAWLDDHQVPHDSLTFSTDKRIVPVDAFIEDSARNVEQLEAAGITTYMVNRPYNQHLQHDPRVDTIADAVEQILATTGATA